MGKPGGGPAGLPGRGGGALFFGSAGRSLFGVEGVDPEAELLLLLDFELCLGGGPVGLQSK